jgi:hypothetical protein
VEIVIDLFFFFFFFLFREALDVESTDLNERVDKTNIDRMNDVSDLSGKVSMLGKSASRHIENLKNHVSRECQVRMCIVLHANI